jgi:polysaccharide pyruvyl transferase WcaK-like protein
MKLALLNVKFSPNLGDGLLSECLEAELRKYPDVDATSLDLAGRRDYELGSSRRRLALLILSRSPQPLRHGLVRFALGGRLQRVLRPRWRDNLQKTDAIVLGGGNLLSDQDLNFPLKIAAAMQEVASLGLPVAVFGVGVSDNWSVPGKRLFLRALTQNALAHAAVRDSRSSELWQSHLVPHGIMTADTCRDPAVLAARHYPSQKKHGGNRRVALGIMDPLAVRYHAAGTSSNEAKLNVWYADLARQLAARSWHIELFTNGSPEDRAYLARLAPRLVAQAYPFVSVAPVFRRPADLANFISRADLVLAHRLHASIAAFAYGVPHVGFAWDPKLKAFFQSVGRGDSVLDLGKTSVSDAVECAAAALAKGVDPAMRARVESMALEDIGRLHRRLSEAVERRKSTTELCRND